MKRGLLPKRAWVGLGLFFVLVYGLSVGRVHSNYADADDLILAARFGGLAHPPGYIWWTQLLHGVAVLLPNTALSWGLGAVNAAVAVAVVVLMAVVAAEMLTLARIPRRTAEVIGMLTACVWGVSGLVWWHASVVEVFAAAQLLILLTWWRGMAALRERAPSWQAALAGVAAVVFHPLSLVAVAPLLAWLLGKRRSWRLVAEIGVSLVVLLGIYAGMVLWAGRSERVYSWPVAHSLVGVGRFFWRSDLLAVSGSAVEVDVGARSLSKELASVWQWVAALGREWGWGGVMLALLGGAWWWRRRQWRWWVAASAFLSGPAVVLYLTLPVAGTGAETAYFWGTALRLRMLFCWQLVMGLLLAGGMTAVWQWKRSWWRGFRLAVAAAVVVSVVTGGRTFLIRQYSYAAELTRYVLESLPEKAVLVVDSDMLFGFLYEQLILGVRTDVAIVSPRIVVQPTWWRQQFGSLYHLESDDATTMAAEIVSWSTFLSKRVFLYAPDSAVLEYLGGEGNPFYIAPYGYALEVGRVMPPVRADFTYPLSALLAADADAARDWWLAGFRAHLAAIHTQAAYYYARLQLTEPAREQMTLATTLAAWPRTKETIKQAVALGEERFLHLGSYVVYARPLPEAYLNAARQKLIEGDVAEAWFAASRAVMVAPHSEEARQLLEEVGRVYGSLGVKETVRSL